MNLENYLRRVPSMQQIYSGVFDSGLWWVKFSIDIKHPLAWNVVQEIGFVANYVSIEDRLPTVFYPVSAPPYLNGGPEDYLCWVIENKQIDFTPDSMTEWLEGRLPRPVDDLSEWVIDEDDED